MINTGCKEDAEIAGTGLTIDFIAKDLGHSGSTDAGVNPVRGVVVNLVPLNQMGTHCNRCKIHAGIVAEDIVVADCDISGYATGENQIG